jgi:ABC-type uncharacterized transport system permease subunit
MNVEPYLIAATLVLYFCASVAYHTHLFVGVDHGRRVATLLVATGVLMHIGAIGGWCTAHVGGSLLRDPGMPFSLVAFFLALIQVALDFRLGWAALGSLSLPLAFVAQSYALTHREGVPIEAPDGARFLSPHVLPILLAFVGFTLAFCLAVLYLVQSRLLKKKRIRGLFRRLPPLDAVGTGAHWLAALGFSMLTIGIVTGALAAPEKWGPGWISDPRTLTSLVAWAIYAAYLGSSIFMGWRGRRTTYFLIAGFLVVLVAFFVSVRHPRTTRASAAAMKGATSCRFASPLAAVPSPWLKAAG